VRKLKTGDIDTESSNDELDSESINSSGYEFIDGFYV
jgi:hypothetical protein